MPVWSHFPRANAGALLALDLFALLVALMAGRVIPAFTANAVPAARPHKNRHVEIAAFGTLGVLAAGTWLPGADMWLAAVTVIGAIAHGVRLWLWDPASTVREPLLCILPLSYAWLPVSLVLRALWLADAGVPAAPSLHALGIGAMGGLMLGMMTRSALGHTGRPLAAGTVETAAYVLVHLAAAVRVFVPLAEPGAASLAAGVSRRRRLLALVGGSLRDLPRRLLAGPHAPACGRTADTEGTCQQDRRIPAGSITNGARHSATGKPPQNLKTFMLRSPPPSLVPDPDLSWDRKREPPTEVATVPFVRHRSAFLARLEWEICVKENVRLIAVTGGNAHERPSPPAP